MDSKIIIHLIKRKKYFKKKSGRKRLKYLYYIIIIIIIIISFKFNIIKLYNTKKEKISINEQNNKNNIKLRKQMFKLLSKISNKTITSLDDVYLGNFYRLGNSLLALNKVIYYCEIMQCKRIFLNKYYYPLIKNTIYDKKYGLTISILTDFKKNNITSLFHWPRPFITTLIKRPENRFDVFKEEILNNLPKPSINKNDLYIHIRNGDIYNKRPRGRYYAQPPLCFYKKVIQQNKFTNVYIIAVNGNFTIIQKLITEYKNTKYIGTSIKEDAAKLVYAYNIVASISSFLTCLIKFNDNLKYLWEYDIYHRGTKINHLHHSVLNFTRKYTIYRMKPSSIYLEKMNIWRKTNEQLNLMMNDTCPNNFTIIKPNK